MEVAWEEVEEAGSTCEPVSRVFDETPAVRRKVLKAMQLKVEQKRALVQRYWLRYVILCIVIWGRIQDFEVLIFWFCGFADSKVLC